jgi:competence protein ComEC
MINKSERSLVQFLTLILLTVILTTSCGQDNRITNNYEPPAFEGSISAPDSVYTRHFFISSVKAIDNQGLDVKVRFDWGDGTISEYTGFAASASVFSQAHSYTSPGFYTIRAIVKNSAGLVTDENNPTHTISVTVGEFSNLINDLIIHDNKLHLSTSTPVNLEFEYQTVTGFGKVYESYSAASKRDFHLVPLPVESSNIEYQMNLAVKTVSVVHDTLLYFTSTNSEYPLLQVDFVDVRQGDGMLITTPEGDAIAVDGGYGSRIPSFSQGSYWNGNGQPLMLEHVIARDIGHFRYLVETHNHMDHWSGLADIKDHQIPYDFYLSPDEPLGLQAGDYLNVESEVTFEILNIDFPPGVSPSSENNRSIVLRIEYGEIAYLLTGDAESPVENYLIDSGYNLSADILKAGHHGSRTSSKPGFLAAALNRVNQIVILSFGTGNPYNHPHDIHRFADYDTYGTNQPSESWQGDNYRFNVGTISTYTDGYIIIVGY